MAGPGDVCLQTLDLSHAASDLERLIAGGKADDALKHMKNMSKDMNSRIRELQKREQTRNDEQAVSTTVDKLNGRLEVVERENAELRSELAALNRWKDTTQTLDQQSDRLKSLLSSLQSVKLPDMSNFEGKIVKIVDTANERLNRTSTIFATQINDVTNPLIDVLSTAKESLEEASSNLQANVDQAAKAQTDLLTHTTSFDKNLNSSITKIKNELKTQTIDFEDGITRVTGKNNTCLESDIKTFDENSQRVIEHARERLSLQSCTFRTITEKASSNAKDVLECVCEGFDQRLLQHTYDANEHVNTSLSVVEERIGASIAHFKECVEATLTDAETNTTGMATTLKASLRQHTNDAEEQLVAHVTAFGANIEGSRQATNSRLVSDASVFRKGVAKTVRKAKVTLDAHSAGFKHDIVRSIGTTTADVKNAILTPVKDAETRLVAMTTTFNGKMGRRVDSTGQQLESYAEEFKNGVEGPLDMARSSLIAHASDFENNTTEVARQVRINLDASEAKFSNSMMRLSQNIKGVIDEQMSTLSSDMDNVIENSGRRLDAQGRTFSNAIQASVDSTETTLTHDHIDQRDTRGAKAAADTVSAGRGRRAGERARSSQSKTKETTARTNTNNASSQPSPTSAPARSTRRRAGGANKGQLALDQPNEPPTKKRRLSSTAADEEDEVEVWKQECQAFMETIEVEFNEQLVQVTELLSEYTQEQLLDQLVTNCKPKHWHGHNTKWKCLTRFKKNESQSDIAEDLGSCDITFWKTRIESLKGNATSTRDKLQTARRASKVSNLCTKDVVSLQTLAPIATLPEPFDEFTTWEQKYAGEEIDHQSTKASLTSLTTKYDNLKKDHELSRRTTASIQREVSTLRLRLKSACEEASITEDILQADESLTVSEEELDKAYSDWQEKKTKLRDVESKIKQMDSMADRRRSLDKETAQELANLTTRHNALQQEKLKMDQESQQLVERLSKQRKDNDTLGLEIKAIKIAVQSLRDKRIGDQSEAWAELIKDVNTEPGNPIMSAPTYEAVLALKKKIDAALTTAIAAEIKETETLKRTELLQSRLNELDNETSRLPNIVVVSELEHPLCTEYGKVARSDIQELKHRKHVEELEDRIFELQTGSDERATNTATPALTSNLLAEFAKVSQTQFEDMREQQHVVLMEAKTVELQTQTSAKEKSAMVDTSQLGAVSKKASKAEVDSIQRTNVALAAKDKVSQLENDISDHEKISIRDHNSLEAVSKKAAKADVDSVHRTNVALAVNDKISELERDAAGCGLTIATDHAALKAASKKASTAEVESIRREMHAEIATAKVIELSNDAASFDKTHIIDDTEVKAACKKAAKAIVGSIRREMTAKVIDEQTMSSEHELAVPVIDIDQTMVLRQTSEKAAHAAAGRMVREKEVKVFARKIQDLEARMLNDSNVAANNATLSGELSRKAQANAREEAGQLVESEKNAALEAKLAELRSLPPVVSVDVDVVRQQLTAAQRELCETVMIAKEVEILQTAKEDLEQKTIASSAPQSSAQARAALDTSLEMRQMIESTTAELNTEKRGHAECSARLADASSQLREVRLQMDKEALIRELLRHVRSSMHELNTIEDHDKLLEQASASKARVEQLVARGSTAPNDIELLGAISDIDESLKSFRQKWWSDNRIHQVLAEMEVKVAAWEKSLDRHYVSQQQFDNACAILHSCITGDKLLSPEHTCHVRALIEAAMEEDNAVMIQPCDSAFLYDLSFCGQFEDNILDRSIEALIELLWTRVVFEPAGDELVMTIVELISGRLMTPTRLDAMHQHMAILSAATLVESFAEDVRGHTTIEEMTRRLTPVLLLQAILRVPHCPASMTTIRSLVDKLTQLMA
ncbi:hypothetical protein Slin14017_G034370 [Septoria linicola]|nr:hypothetical protein Slin14017_G034370 [Septoria linicola]